MIKECRKTPPCRVPWHYGVLPKKYTVGRGRLILTVKKSYILSFLTTLLVATAPPFLSYGSATQVMYRNLSKNQPFTEMSGICLSTRDSSLKFKFSLYEFFTKSLNHRLYFIKKAIPLQEPPSLLLTQKEY